MRVAALILLLAWAMAPSRAIAQRAAVDSNVDASATVEVVPLWSGAAPRALGSGVEDRPTLAVYRAGWRGPSDPPTAAVIVLPGGGYGGLAANHEGRQVANWLNSLGITAFVVRYRLGPKYHHPVELMDAQRALRLVRARAAEYGVRPNQIGIMGFSAGGHLAATVATQFDAGLPNGDATDRVSSRPDFAILGYPVITLLPPYAHTGSAKNLLGENADSAQLAAQSAERNVTPQTPPTFLVHTNDDDVVPVENSVAFYSALRKAGVPAELHIFERGAHGLGLGGNNAAFAQWPLLLQQWLRARGLTSVSR